MKKCDGCGRPAGPGARSHRHRLICTACQSVLINLGLLKDQCPKAHKFTPENTYVTATGYWQCRECGRENVADRQGRTAL